MARWTAELALIGWTPDRLASSVDAAPAARIAGGRASPSCTGSLGVAAG